VELIQKKLETTHAPQKHLSSSLNPLVSVNIEGLPICQPCGVPAENHSKGAKNQYNPVVLSQIILANNIAQKLLTAAFKL
jgi:hypothetical protein